MVDMIYILLFGDNVIIYVIIIDLESNFMIMWERQGENEVGFNVINMQINVKYGGGILLFFFFIIYNIIGIDVGYYCCKVINIDGIMISLLIYIGLKSGMQYVNFF